MHAMPVTQYLYAVLKAAAPSLCFSPQQLTSLVVMVVEMSLTRVRMVGVVCIQQM